MDILSRLRQAPSVLMDGAIATELQRRGAPMSTEIWGGTVMLTHPALIRETHRDFALSGAEIHTANTYNTAPHLINRTNLNITSEAFNRLAVSLVREGIEEAAPGHRVWIAGSISTAVEGRRHQMLANAELRESYKVQANSLAEEGCDLLLLEMMLTHDYAIELDFQYEIAEIAKQTGLPVWGGMSVQVSAGGVPYLYEHGPASSGQLAAAMATFLARSVDVAGIMHSDVEAISPALALLQQHWSGPIAVYPNSGTYERPNWQFDTVLSPEAFAEAALNWVTQGANAVGGCCGLGPEHIAALREALRSSPYTR